MYGTDSVYNMAIKLHCVLQHGHFCRAARRVCCGGRHLLLWQVLPPKSHPNDLLHTLHLAECARTLVGESARHLNVATSSLSPWRPVHTCWLVYLRAVWTNKHCVTPFADLNLEGKDSAFEACLLMHMPSVPVPSAPLQFLLHLLAAEAGHHAGPDILQRAHLQRRGPSLRFCLPALPVSYLSHCSLISWTCLQTIDCCAVLCFSSGTMDYLGFIQRRYQGRRSQPEVQNGDASFF